MTISPRAGDIYGESTDAKNILLQNAPGDWTIETKLVCSITPYASYQQGGIIVYQDMNNYMKLDWESNNSTNIIQACWEVDGADTATSVDGSVVGSDNTLWLRMVKEGNVYTSYYSTNGTDFTQVGGENTLNFSNVQAGLIAINGSGTNTDLDVKYDYFHNSASTVVPLPADKSALTAMINTAQALNGSDYTTETWTNLQTALNAAIAQKDDPEALQADVDTACSNLQAAIDALLPKGAAVIITGSGSVQPGSSFAVGICLNTVDKNVYAEDITLSYDPAVFEYDTTTKTGENVNILRSEPNGTGEVRIIAANIGGLTGSNAPLLDVSFKVKSGVAAISSDISVTKAKLGIMPERTAIQAGLSSKTITVGDMVIVNKGALKAAIDEAQSVYDGAVVGTQNGCYLKSDKDTFKAAIDAADAVYTNAGASQAEVDNAAAALNTAISTFKASAITAGTGDINNSSTINVGDLAIIAYYYGANSTSENWAAAKVADINKDNKVDIEDLAFNASRLAD
jgi:regulation of enolase protein 1 (concanavalin A-like superfamily)